MRIGVLGTGMVGRALATRLIEVGHDVRLGSRSTTHQGSAAWVAQMGDHASAGDFASAAGFGELVVNATAGSVTLAALELAGEQQLAGKILIDVCNPLRSDGDGPLPLTVANTDSVGEQIQRAHPRTRVVKALNTMNCDVMVAPDVVPGDHAVFICGEDADAKRTVTDLLGSFGWPASRIVDLGGIQAARGTEAFMLLWLPMWRAIGHGHFNIAIHQEGQRA
jgi:predicted dinucleotide-binding enzyme